MAWTGLRPPNDEFSASVDDVTPLLVSDTSPVVVDDYRWENERGSSGVWTNVRPSSGAWTTVVATA
jgi:hypothetical protein